MEGTFELMFSVSSGLFHKGYDPAIMTPNSWVALVSFGKVVTFPPIDQTAKRYLSSLILNLDFIGWLIARL